MTDKYPNIIEDLWPFARPIDDCKIDPANAMRHKDEDLNETASSLHEFKQRTPIVVNTSDGKNIIEKGNGTWLAAKRLGWTHIAAVGQDDDPVTHVRYGIADNATGRIAKWDVETLDTLLGQMDDPTSVPGVTAEMAEQVADELKALANGSGEEKDTEPQVNRADELRQEWGTAEGQLWQLGEHRLVCGDCTDAAVVAKVMKKQKLSLCVTSPPYPGASMWDNQEEDKGQQINRLIELSKTTLTDLWTLLMEGGIVCWNVQDIPWGNHGIITTTTTTTIAVKEIGYSIRGNIIWDKGIPHLPLPWNMRRPCVPNMTHEHILVLFKGDWIPREKKTGLNSEEKGWLAHGVWKIATESAKRIGHKAPYPLELPKRCIGLFSLKDDIVYDPFLGSGTTMIACENLNRKCIGIEIDPGYVAVTLQRYLDHSGVKPELID